MLIFASVHVVNATAFIEGVRSRQDAAITTTQLTKSCMTVIDALSANKSDFHASLRLHFMEISAERIHRQGSGCQLLSLYVNAVIATLHFTEHKVAAAAFRVNF